jgi:hypothetical protein
LDGDPNVRFSGAGRRGFPAAKLRDPPIASDSACWGNGKNGLVAVMRQRSAKPAFEVV